MERKYADDYGNIATIDYDRLPAYKGDKFLNPSYRVTCTAMYPSYMTPYVYHVSVFESMEEALNDLHRLSCGTFKEIAE